MKLPRHFFEGCFTRFEEYLLKQKHILAPFRKGERLLRDHKIANAYFYIQSGTCAIYSTTEQGARKISCFYSSGCFTNIAIDDNLESIYFHQVIEALSDGTVLLFDKETILKILRENFDFVLQMLSFTNEMLALLTYQNLTLPCLPSDTKLCDCLYMFYHYHTRFQKENPRRLWYSQEQIGDCIGVTRTQVTRLLRSLKAQGIIETHRGSIEIIDPPRLLEQCSNVVNCQ